MFTRSQKLYADACEVLAMGVSSGIRRHVTTVPLYFDRADGPYFWDVDGNRLLDYTLGWGPLIAGNNHPHINAAITRQLQRGYTFGAQHELEVCVARQIVNMVPDVEQVIFSNSGSEAVQAALRIARATTARNKIVKFEGHYHGWMNNVLVSYHPTSGAPTAAQKSCGGQPESEYGETIVLPWNDTDSVRKLFERAGHEIAAVIMEPLLANSGSCEPRDSYLQTVIDLCREFGVISIFDEVITGFRLARGGAREYYGVSPDLSIYGKALAGGFSLSAVVGCERMFDVLRDDRTIHVGTYNGNPICLAAAKATLEILADPEVFARMHAHGQSLQETLRTTAAASGTQLAICGTGTVFSVHCGVSRAPLDYRQTLQSNMEAYTRFRLSMLENGIYLLPDGRWYVGAAHDENALDLARAAIQLCMRRMDE